MVGSTLWPNNLKYIVFVYPLFKINNKINKQNTR